MKNLLYLSLALTTLLVSCGGKKNKDEDEDKKIVYLKSREKAPSQPKEEIAEKLMKELTNVEDSATEAKLMDSLWGFSRPILTDEPLKLSLRAVDSEGNQVINQLPSAVGNVTAKLTMSNNKGWRKSVEFSPISIYNLQGMMRE